MGMIVNNLVSTSIGIDMGGLWFKTVFHTQELLTTGKVYCDLFFYKSEGISTTADRIFPIGSGKKINSCLIEMNVDDIVKSSGVTRMSDVVLFFCTKVKEKLFSLYGWDITIEM